MLAKNRVAVMAIMRSLIAAAVMAGFLAGPAYAQKAKKQQNDALVAEELQKRKDAEAIDREYKSTLQRTRKEVTETHVNDPWANMRGNDASKAKR